MIQGIGARFRDGLRLEVAPITAQPRLQRKLSGVDHNTIVVRRSSRYRAYVLGTSGGPTDPL